MYYAPVIGLCPEGEGGGYRAYPRGLTFLHFLKCNFPTLGIEFFVKVPHPRANISISQKLFSPDSAKKKKTLKNCSYKKVQRLLLFILFILIINIRSNVFICEITDTNIWNKAYINEYSFNTTWITKASLKSTQFPIWNLDVRYIYRQENWTHLADHWSWKTNSPENYIPSGSTKDAMQRSAIH